jgi:hypothetical protein
MVIVTDAAFGSEKASAFREFFAIFAKSFAQFAVMLFDFCGGASENFTAKIAKGSQRTRRKSDKSEERCQQVHRLESCQADQQSLAQAGAG